MEFLTPLRPGVHSLAILPGSFHPPTVAHAGLARAALDCCDAVLWTMPRVFPHKNYGGVGMEERLDMVRKVIAGQPCFAAGISDGGLFIDMAREVKDAIGPGAAVYVICGRDAAERIAGWDYETAPGIEDQLREYTLLVSGREGEYAAPAHLAPGVRSLSRGTEWEGISSTAVRNAIAAGDAWEWMVPASIHDDVERLYSPCRFDSRNARKR